MAFYQANLIRKSLSAFERDRKLDSNVMPYAHVFWFWQVDWSLACINDNDALEFCYYCIPNNTVAVCEGYFHTGDMVISFRCLKYFPLRNTMTS